MFRFFVASLSLFLCNIALAGDPAKPKCQGFGINTLCTFKPNNNTGESFKTYQTLLKLLDRGSTGRFWSDHPTNPFNEKNTTIDHFPDTNTIEYSYGSTENTCPNPNGSSEKIHCLDLIAHHLMQLDTPKKIQVKETINLEFSIVEVRRSNVKNSSIGAITRIQNENISQQIEGNDFAQSLTPSEVSSSAGFDQSRIAGFGAQSVIQTVVDQIGVDDLLLNVSLGRWNNFVENKSVYPLFNVERGASFDDTLISKRVFITQEGEDAVDLGELDDRASGEAVTYDKEKHLITINNFSFTFHILNSIPEVLSRETNTLWGLRAIDESVIQAMNPFTRYNVSSDQLILTPGVSQFLTTVNNVRRDLSKTAALNGYSRVLEESELDILFTVTAMLNEQSFQESHAQAFRNLNENQAAFRSSEASQSQGHEDVAKNSAAQWEVQWPAKALTYRPNFTFSPSGPFEPTYRFRIPLESMPLLATDQFIILKVSSPTNAFPSFETDTNGQGLAIGEGLELKVPLPDSNLENSSVLNFWVEVFPHPSSSAEFIKNNPPVVYKVEHHIRKERLTKGHSLQPLFQERAER